MACYRQVYTGCCIQLSLITEATNHPTPQPMIVIATFLTIYKGLEFYADTLRFCSGGLQRQIGGGQAVLVGFCWYRLLLEDLQIFVGRFVDICWKICRFLLVHSIVGRFVDICWKICRFLLVQFLLLEDLQISVGTVILLEDLQISVGTFNCWKICRYLLEDLKLTLFCLYRNKKNFYGVFVQLCAPQIQTHKSYLSLVVGQNCRQYPEGKEFAIINITARIMYL